MSSSRRLPSDGCRSAARSLRRRGDTSRGRTWLHAAVATAVVFSVGVAIGAPVKRVAGPEPTAPLFRLQAISESGVVVLDWDRAAARAAVARGGREIVRGVTLQRDLTVDLELEPFSVIAPDAKIVLGRKNGIDVELPFDPSRVSLFRGRVAGESDSHVYLALSETHSTGYVELGATRYRIGSADSEGEDLPAGSVSVFETPTRAALPPDVPLCGSTPEAADTLGSQYASRDASADGSDALESSHPQRGLLHMELAVETDHEFFVLFDGATEAMDYLTAMYGEVSDIYIRDVDTRVELVFARLWDNPDDLFNVVDPSPLSDFRDYWNANMQGVARDVAQLFSGRRDYPFGGQAYLSALCNTSAYSVVGYALGFFPDPSRPSVYGYDIAVTAHEIGHNAGTGHTHDSPNLLDDCDDPATVPRRGSIMSYCGQTWSGGNANRDLYFHSRIQQNMDSYIGSVTCVVDDCNRNGVADATDISNATSADANGNGVPDECEDCNDNGTLDDADIAGASNDVDGNGIPDECQPDCNNNGIPDLKDIADGTSVDAYGNDIPDECEEDCDSSGGSDFSQIQANMTLDIDRDRRLDSCQDCDTNGTTDFDELEGAHYAWVASGQAGSDVRHFHAQTGVLAAISSGGGQSDVNEGYDLRVLPSGGFAVSGHADDRVMEFDAAGAYQGNLVSAGSGGLDGPAGLEVTPDGTTLLVSSMLTNEVLAYDVVTGSSQGAFVTAGSGGLAGPFGLIFGPNGNLFVTGSTNEVYEYDGTTGAFVGVFVAAATNGGLDQPRGIAFKPDGEMLVASYGTNEVLAFDGTTGAPRGKWAQVGTATRLTQVSPWGVRVGPNGNVFVVRTGDEFGSSSSGGAHNHDDHDHGNGNGHGAGGHHHHDDEHGDVQHQQGDVVALHLTNAQMYEYDATNGNFLRTYIGGNDHGLVFPSGFDFAPRWDLDCNQTQLPDSCDIALGFSEDLDMNGTPDECEEDCNSNGEMDRLEIIPYGTALDCNGNLVPDSCDLASGASTDCTANGIPDECEIDCNFNGIADSCDVDSGTSEDCNLNGIPDECDVTDDAELDTGWTQGVPGDNATTGQWTRVDPIGTGAQPEDDHTPGGGRFCFVTGQGSPGGGAGEADIDGGITTLVSPNFDVSDDPDVEIGYWRWFSNDQGGAPNEDVLQVDVSDDGGQNWTTVETVGPTGPEVTGGWLYHQFRVGDFVTPTTEVALRFIAGDLGSGSIVEAAVDDLSIIATCCVASAEVVGLTVNESGGVTTVSWNAQGAGAVYDVVSGTVSDLRADGGVDAATCQADDLATNTWDDARAEPAPDDGYYYLVRATECAAGDYGLATDGSPRLPLADCP